MKEKPSQSDPEYIERLRMAFQNQILPKPHEKKKKLMNVNWDPRDLHDETNGDLFGAEYGPNAHKKGPSLGTLITWGAVGAALFLTLHYQTNGTAVSPSNKQVVTTKKPVESPYRIKSADTKIKPPETPEARTNSYFVKDDSLISLFGEMAYGVEMIQPKYHDSIIKILNEHKLIELEANENHPLPQSVRILNRQALGRPDPRAGEDFLIYTSILPQESTADAKPVDQSELTSIVNELYRK